MNLYKTSVLIWFCILAATWVACRNLIKENGWTKEGEDLSCIESLARLLAYSCIPVFRLLICITFFYFAGRKKEDNQ